MAKVMSSLIALSVLAGAVASVSAQTRDEENGGSYFEYQQDAQGGG